MWYKIIKYENWKLSIQVFKLLIVYFKEKGIDENNLYQRIIDLKIEKDYEIDAYANYDKEKNILKHNLSLNNEKRNVIRHECLHIAGGFENNRGFNEYLHNT